MMDISNDAKAMLLGAFLSENTTLTMQNVERVLSPRAESALTELMERGLIVATKDGLAVSYSQTEAGKKLDRRSLIDGDVFDWMRKNGAFPISTPKAG